jgi:hypothetical protein
MKYKASGIDRTTGQETTRTSDATSKPEAEQIAQRSMVVAEIEAVQSQVPPVEYESASRPP